MLALELSFIFVFVFLIVTSLPTGFFLIKLTNILQIKKENILPVSFVMVSLGLVLNVAIYYLIGYILFNLAIIIIVPVFFSVIDLIIIRKRGIFSTREGEILVQCRDQYNSKTNKFFLFISTIVFFYVMLNDSFILFPTAGDAWTHGRFIAMIIFDGKIPTDFIPFDSATIVYPLAFHVFSAAISLSLSIEYGIGMLTFTGCLLVLTCILTVYVVYRQTHSTVFSSLVAYLFFQVHPSGNADMSVLLEYLNGTYTVILAILIVVTSFICLQEILASKRKDAFLLLVLGVVFSVCTFLTYPSFIVVVVPLYGFCILFSFNKKLQFGNMFKFLKSVKGIILLLGFFAIIFGGIYLLTGPFNYILQDLFQSTSYHDYLIMDSYFLEGFYLPIIIVSILSAYFLSKDPKWRPLSIGYLIVLGVILLSAIPELYEIGLWHILPRRTMLLLEVFAICFDMMLPYYFIQKLIKKDMSHRWMKYRLNIRINKITKYTEIVVFLMTIVSCFTLATFMVEDSWSGFTRDPAFQSDLEGMRYLHDHTSGTELILNYAHASEYFFPTFGLLNPVYALPCNTTRAIELEQIWWNPDNETLVQDLLAKYNISYVFVSSMAKIFRLFDNRTYQLARVNWSTCFNSFKAYTFLNQIYNQDNCSIFKIVT